MALALLFRRLRSDLHPARAVAGDAVVGVDHQRALVGFGRLDAVAAALVADICTRYEIPIRKLTLEQVAAREPGICGHIDVTKAFKTGTHWDPGPAFPWGLFIAMVRAAAGLE